jgi:anti-anti-sigma regulatory factor
LEEGAVSVTFDREAEPGLIRLKGDVDISQAEDLKRILLDALAAGHETRIAMETMTSIDITAVQLLWAAEREARKSGMILLPEGKAPDALTILLREAGFDRFPLAGKIDGTEVR